MDHCPNYSGFLIGRHKKEPRAIICRSRCGQWDCEYCRSHNRAIWRARVIASVQAHGGLWFMLTLTAHEGDRSTAGSLKNIQKGWGRSPLTVINPRTLKENKARGLHGYLRIENPQSPFAYLRVYEPHQNRAMHAHFLTNYHPLDYVHPRSKHAPGSRTIKDKARAAGMGYMTQIECVGTDAEYSASYVLKYLTKDLAGLPRGTRRIQATNDFLIPQPSEPSSFAWETTPDLHLRQFSALFSEGREVWDVDLDRLVTYDDFSLILWYEPTEI